MIEPVNVSITKQAGAFVKRCVPCRAEIATAWTVAELCVNQPHECTPGRERREVVGLVVYG